MFLLWHEYKHVELLDDALSKPDACHGYRSRVAFLLLRVLHQRLPDVLHLHVLGPILCVLRFFGYLSDLACMHAGGTCPELTAPKSRLMRMQMPTPS